MKKVTRRRFLGGTAATVAAFTIVPRHVLGQGQTPPSETFGAALIGCGSRGPGTFGSLYGQLSIRPLAACDVHRDSAERFRQRLIGDAQKKGQEIQVDAYQDFRRVVERKDIDVVAIATPPHWHALVSIACMESGKDVLCEKPMTRFVAEGRAVAKAAERYGRIFQIGTYGRFGQSRHADAQLTRKIMASGLMPKDFGGVYLRRGGFKVKEWSGRLDVPITPPPEALDWDLYCGPSPLKPFQAPRHGGTHRWYWDYEGGGLGDMGQHHLDPVTWTLAKDDTAPVEIEASAAPAHPEVAGMWDWVKLTYADGFTLVLESGEWDAEKGLVGRGEYEGAGLSAKLPRLEDLPPEAQEKIKAMPDPEPLVSFGEAVKTRRQPGGNAEAAHRTACLMHLANVAIRTGRRIRFDPDREEVVGDPEANRLVNQPMRAPWHL